MKIFRYRHIVLAAAGLLLLACVGTALQPLVTAKPAMADVTRLPVIVLDPGHGGVDGGAVGPDGLVEKEINLEICLKLRDFFESGGFEVVLTRETDISIHDEGVKGVRNQKVSDLKNRLALSQTRPGSILISIHQNKFPIRSSWGTQIFYGSKNPQSESLAQLIQDNAKVLLQPENNRQIKKAGTNLFLMTEADCPAVLVECGFLSNSGDASRLQQPKYQAQLAFAVFGSVLQYLNLDAPAPSGEMSAA